MGSLSHWESNEVPLDLSSNSANVEAKSLNIVWGKDPRHWKWINISREPDLEGFKEGAALLQVNWLEVVGKVNVVSRLAATTCEIYYIIKFSVDEFGWDSTLIKFKINIEGEVKERRVNLEPYTRNKDAWHKINGGEFEVPPDKPVSLSFCMLENESGWWKGGMIIAGVMIKPKIPGHEAT